MDRNTNAYSTVDTVEIPRSHWTRNHTLITTFNAGKLVPIYFNEDIIPGSTIKMKTSFVVRLQTPLNPTMDNLVLDTYWFAAPKWWYWEHFKEQFLENPNGAWAQTTQYNTPMIDLPTSGTAYGPGDLANYLGIPQGVTGFKWDRMGINLYCDVWNNWFRSQVVQAPIIFDKSDNDYTADGTILSGYGLLPTNRTFDINSSCLIEPQKALPGYQNGVTMPLGTYAPIKDIGSTDTADFANMRFRDASTGTILSYTTPADLGVGTAGNAYVGSGYMSGTPTKVDVAMVADLSAATSATINALRLSVAIQRIEERSAIFGSLYRDTLRMWGAVASSMDTMIPEYLGGTRVPINIETCLQNSGSTSTSPLGETGAFSVTTNTNLDFTKSFTMHYMLIGLATVRVEKHKYSQGLHPQFTRVNMLDHYFPALAHIGNTPRYNKNIYLQDDAVVNSDGKPVNNDVFGYQEAWQEYISAEDRATGEMNPVYTQSLSSWHYGDKYTNLPVLGDTWMQESLYNIDRTLAVTSTEAHQFFGDFYFEEEVSAPIPLNRIPGLMDHY